MSGRPDLLDGYTEATSASFPRALDAVDRYRTAVAAFNTAEPDDLGVSLRDRSGDIEESLDGLRTLDRIPAAFAAALRHLDASYHPDAQMPGQTLQARDDDLRFLVAAYLVEPDASEDDAARLAARLRDAANADSLEHDLGRLVPPEILDGVRVVLDVDGWHESLAQFARHAGNAALASYESNRAAALRSRYPASSRVVVQAQRAATEAAETLAANERFLPSLGVHAPPAASPLLSAARGTTAAVGWVGMGYSAVDAYYDYENEDWGGLVSNGFALAGGGMLLFTSMPVVATVGGVFVVGSLVYETNRERIDNMARAIGDFFGF